MKLMGRTLQCDGHVYLSSTPADMVDKATMDLAAKKHLPPRDDEGRKWRPRDLLSRGDQERLKDYEDVVAGNNDNDDEHNLLLFCDVCQNIGFGSVTTVVPALTRSSALWSLAYARPVLREEKMEAMGIPCINCEMTLGLPMPWQGALGQLTNKQIDQLIGNSMHRGHLQHIDLHFGVHGAADPAEHPEHPIIDERGSAHQPPTAHSGSRTAARRMGVRSLERAEKQKKSCHSI